MSLKDKLKKVVKKVGKAAAIGGLGYAAIKGLGGKKFDTGLTKGKFLMSGAAGGARFPKPFSRANMRDIAGSGDVMPGNLSKSAGATGKNMYDGAGSSNPRKPGGLKSGGRAGYKHGGSAKKRTSAGNAVRGHGKEIK